MGLFSRRSSGSTPRLVKNGDNVKDTVEALQTLQRTLHLLTPREQADVRTTLPFAASEWLEGVALSIRAQAESVTATDGDSKHSGTMTAAQLLVQETADQARIRLTPDSGKVILIMVGLPARGKSTLCHRMEHFFAWRGYVTKSFRVGARRRQASENGAALAEQGQGQYSSASFFDSSKAFATATREAVTQEAFDDLIDWLKGDEAQIAIFDASNVTIERRAKLQEKATKAKMGVVFIESICTDQEVIHRESLWKVRNSADFVNLDEADALRDLQERILHYEKVYKTVREEEGAYIKIYDLRAKAQCCNIYGRMANKVLPFLLATHSIPRPIFLLRLPGGDDAMDLVQAAREAICKWAAGYERKSELKILTSTEPHALEVANALADAAGAKRPEHRSQLAPLPAKAFRTNATSLEARSFSKKFGESVADLVTRLEPIVLELEGATEPVVIIAQEAPCRTIRKYLQPGQIDEMSTRDSVDPSFPASPARRPTQGEELDELQLIEISRSESSNVEERAVPLD